MTENTTNKEKAEQLLQECTASPKNKVIVGQGVPRGACEDHFEPSACEDPFEPSACPEPNAIMKSVEEILEMSKESLKELYQMPLNDYATARIASIAEVIKALNI